MLNIKTSPKILFFFYAFWAGNYAFWAGNYAVSIFHIWAIRPERFTQHSAIRQASSSTGIFSSKLGLHPTQLHGSSPLARLQRSAPAKKRHQPQTGTMAGCGWMKGNPVTHYTANNNKVHPLEVVVVLSSFLGSSSPKRQQSEQGIS